MKTRSGLKTKLKSLPARSPETSSSIFAKRFLVVPTGRVVSNETKVPGLNPLAISPVAESIASKFGVPSELTINGTTTTTKSDFLTASVVFVVARSVLF